MPFSKILFTTSAAKLASLSLMLLATLCLAACSDAPPTPVARFTTAAPTEVNSQSNLTSNPVTTVATTAASAGTAAPTPSIDAAAALPTATVPVVPSRPPTAFPTATLRAGQLVPVIKPSITAVRTTRASFKVAYGKAAALAADSNRSARLVMAQLSEFSLERTFWTFFFTVPGGNTWAVNYDSANPRDKKENITIRQVQPVLPDEAGQWQAANVLDSDEIGARLERAGLPPDLPLDTVFVQLGNTVKGRIPVYTFINTALSKQLVVNAQTGEILQNDFR